MALLLLASRDVLPRQRARDQQADMAGSALKARILNELVGLDPEPEELEATLEQIVVFFGSPHGPTRAIALGILEEWRATCESPEFVAWLLAQAVYVGQEPEEKCGRGRKNRQAAEASDSGAA
jgi:hypothetical protein